MDLTESGWTVGTSSLNAQISNGSGSFRGIPYPADYEITLFDHVVDTSSTLIGSAPIPITFTVRNITEDRFVEAVFVEQDNDQALSRNDQVFIVEEDEDGAPVLTWLIRFLGDENAEPPVPGDVFFLRILKPFSGNDVFEFTTSTTGVSVSDQPSPSSAFRLFQNYPNPFNPTTTIRYDLPRPGHVTLTVYNVMGQEVALLISAEQGAGRHAATWDAAGLASGAYVYRLRAGAYSEARIMLLLK